MSLTSKTPATATPDPREMVRMVEAGEAVLIDVREPGEWAAGHARGAIHVPLATVTMRCDPRSPECLPALKAGKPVVVYCAAGARAARAAGQMSEMGHDVHNAGGLIHWQQAGGKLA
jgi:rhodanese-related sulfurtransferase